MFYFEIFNTVFPHLGVSEKGIEWEIKKRDYARQIAASKLPLSPENLRKRYELNRNFFHQNIGCENSGQMKAGWPFVGTLDVGSQESLVLPSNSL